MCALVFRLEEEKAGSDSLVVAEAHSHSLGLQHGRPEEEPY